ncbi:MAG: hypothetical protein NTNFB02_32930 [Nitrospira sp.]
MRRDLVMTNHRQETGSWCWAGSAQTVNEFIRKLLHDPKDQCNLVSQVFKDDPQGGSASSGEQIDCCLARRTVPMNELGAPEARDYCDRGLWPDDVLSKADIKFLKVSYDPPFDELQGWNDLTWQIDQELPYIVVVRWVGGGRHAVTIGGYSNSPNSGEFVHVYDPGQQDFYIMPFTDFYNGIPSKFAHEFDYFIMRP